MHHRDPEKISYQIHVIFIEIGVGIMNYKKKKQNFEKKNVFFFQTLRVAQFYIRDRYEGVRPLLQTLK